jgi:hypothetical protein
MLWDHINTFVKVLAKNAIAIFKGIRIIKRGNAVVGHSRIRFASKQRNRKMINLMLHISKTATLNSRSNCRVTQKL